MITAEQRQRLGDLARAHDSLRLLVLFGSRATGESHDQSDWDFGYLAEGGLDAEGLSLELIRELGTDDVDVVDLETAGGLLRYRAARDAVVLHEAAGVFRRFWWEAVNFWCDVEPLLRRSYDALLEDLPRS